MPDSGSVLTESGELSSVTNWYFQRKGKPAGRFMARFQISWTNTQSPDVLADGRLRLAGKNFVIHHVYQVAQWSDEEIEVYCIAYAEEK